MASKKNPWTITKDGAIILKDDSQANRKLLRKWITQQVEAQGNTKGYTNIFLGKSKIPHRLGSVDNFFSGKAEMLSFRNKQTAKKAKDKKLKNMTAPNELVLEWAEQLGNKEMWPEGKSLEGFVEWAMGNYRDSQKAAKAMEELTGIWQDAGHAVDKGFSSRTGLGVQPRFHPRMGNQNLRGVAKEFSGDVKKATDNIRTKADLKDVDIAFDSDSAFFEYLNEGNENLDFLTQEGWTQEQKTALLFDTEFDPTARGADIKIRDEILNTGVNRQIAQAQGLFASMADSKAGRAITGAAGKGRTADLIGQTGMHLASGNIVGASIAGTTLAATQALENPAVQRRIARQIASIVKKRGAKTALKMMPGLDVAISGAETWGYLSEGKLDQAAIAAMSGAIGWIPVIGDGASAALDLTNTGLDIARLDYDGIGAPEPETKTKVGEVPDTKLRNINDPLKIFAKAV